MESNTEIKILDGEDQKNLNLVTDPFKKDCIQRINLNARRSTRYDIHKHELVPEIVITGCVDFKNGNTEGTQNFEDEKSLGDLLMKIYSFCISLEEK